MGLIRKLEAMIPAVGDHRADTIREAIEEIKRFYDLHPEDAPIECEIGTAAIIKLNNGQHVGVWDGEYWRLAHEDLEGFSDAIEAIVVIWTPGEGILGTTQVDLEALREKLNNEVTIEPLTFEILKEFPGRIAIDKEGDRWRFVGDRLEVAEGYFGFRVSEVDPKIGSLNCLNEKYGPLVWMDGNND